MLWRRLSGTRLPTSQVPTRDFGAEAHTERAPSDSVLAKVPRYPPYESGIAVVPPGQIVSNQRELIDRIFRAAGMSRDEFKRVETIIENLARFVHQLPATATAHHRLEGGLFRMALEIGLHSLQLANGSVFPTGSVERRYALNPKWHLATFLAGLCSQLWRAVSNVVVVNRTDAQWMPLLAPIYDWAKEQQTDVYFLRWREAANVVGAQASSAFLVNKIVPNEMLNYLSSDNSQVLTAMTSAIAGTDLNPSYNHIARIVAPVTTQVIEDDLKRSPANYGLMSVGYQLEPHLIDAMRRLVKAGTWSPNALDGVLWIGVDGTYLDWSRAAADVGALMGRDSFVGVPKDPDTMADMLCDAGVFERTEIGQRYWSILIPERGILREDVVRFAKRGMALPQEFNFAPYESTRLLATRREDVRTDDGIRREQNVARGPVEATGPSSLEAPRDVERAGQPLTTAAQEGRQPAKPRRPTRVTEDFPAPKDVQRNNEPAGTSEDRRDADSGNRLLGTLKPENADVLRKIIEQQRDVLHAATVHAAPTGIAVTHEELSSHGHDPLDLIDEMAKRDWLWADPVKPMRRLHKLQIKGVTSTAIVIKPEIARLLGLEVRHAAA